MRYAYSMACCLRRLVGEHKMSVSTDVRMILGAFLAGDPFQDAKAKREGSSR